MGVCYALLGVVLVSERLKCLGRVEDRLQDVAAVVVIVLVLVASTGLDVFLVWCAVSNFRWVWPVLVLLVVGVGVLFGFWLLVGWLRGRGSDDDSGSM